MNTLANKTVLVTGASSGLGWSTALAFARAGANLVVTARREDRLKSLVAQIEAFDQRAVYLAGDATEEPTAASAIALAQQHFGGLDILIANAGAGNYKQLVDTSADEYDALMDANMKSTFLFTRHAAPLMIEQKSGVIVIVSSIAGLQGYANEAVYSASKFAQVGFAQAVDAELRKHGIKVVAFCPGGIKTEFALNKGRTEDSIRASHMMDPDELAETIVFTCTQPANLRISQLTVRHMG
jgi:3-oxoacyl-[acyl-carrier protein] reductase